MHFRSALSYESIDRLAVRIKLPKKGEPSYRAEEALTRALKHELCLRALEPEGSKATFWQRTEDEITHMVANRANHYRHNYGRRIRNEDAAIVQWGCRGTPHIRILFDDFAHKKHYDLFDFFEGLHLATGIDREYFESRVIVDELDATFDLIGLGLGDIQAQHRGIYAGSRCEILEKESSELCGYEFGTLRRPAPLHLDRATECETRYASMRYWWRQTRELALKDLLPMKDRLPTVRIHVRSRTPIELSRLALCNPLEGLDIEHRPTEVAPGAPVASWNPAGAWNKVVQELAVIADPSRQA